MDMESDMHCPRCNYKLCSVNWCSWTGEWKISCHQCGYIKQSLCKRDSDDEIILNDPDGPDDHTNVTLVNSEWNSYGVMRLELMAGGTQISTFLTKEGLESFIENELSDSSYNEATLKRVITKRFVNGHVIREVIYQNPNYSY